MNKDKRKHYVDFKAHAKVCEQNYWRLLRLMPNVSDTKKQKSEWSYCFGANASLCLNLRAIKAHKYTLTIVVSYSKLSQFKEDGDSCGSTMLMMAVRVYQDAKIAEVVDNKTFKQLAGHYHYPNTKMYQEDEKLQRNKFLAQLLRSCLKTGVVDDDLLSDFIC